MLFDDLLEKQLLLKGVIAATDWILIKNEIIYEWQSDSHFKELQDAQMMKERLGILVQDMGYRDEVVGKFFSQEYINKKVLKLTQEEIDEIKDQMEQEKLEAAPPPEGGEDQWSEFNPAEGKPDLKVISG
jgi:hypothetical protein